MYIIKIKANENGARPPIQTWNKPTLPEGYAVCPDEFYRIFYSTDPAGFVNIEVEGNTVTAMTVNYEAFEAYLANRPEPVVTPEEEIAELKAKLAFTDYQAIKYAEGVLSAEEYADMKAQRQAWRNRINELEEVAHE